MCGAVPVVCRTVGKSAAESTFGDEEERLGDSKLLEKMLKKRKSHRRIVELKAGFLKRSLVLLVNVKIYLYTAFLRTH